MRYKLRMPIAPLVVLLVSVGCKRDVQPVVRTTAAADALWALAPEGASGGIVVSPSGVAMAETASVALRALITKAPELASIKDQVTQTLTRLGGPNVMLAELGLTHDKGAALFIMKEGMVAIIPVENRDIFLGKVHGTKGATDADVDKIEDVTCKQIDEHYACATAEALLAKIGKGELKSKLERVDARGDIEIIGVELPLGGPAPGSIAMVAQLERGAATLRGVIVNSPARSAGQTRRADPPAHPGRDHVGVRRDRSAAAVLEGASEAARRGRHGRRPRQDVLRPAHGLGARRRPAPRHRDAAPNPARKTMFVSTAKTSANGRRGDADPPNV